VGRSSQSTQRVVAFLRAINVGAHTVTMDRLRSHIASLGVANVETFIASGNVIFDAPVKGIATLEQQIASTLERALGYEVATFIRTIGELAEIAAYEPFPPSEVAKPGHSLHVGFLTAAPRGEIARRVLALQAPSDALHVRGRELYWLRRVPMNESKLAGPLLERTLGAPTTVRNLNTVRRLVAKYAAR
jgi:uncharacterized protein (DUF1697 family)